MPANFNPREDTPREAEQRYINAIYTATQAAYQHLQIQGLPDGIPPTDDAVREFIKNDRNRRLVANGFKPAD